jgi:sigma-B regulation protein RsbU (phosphoserine phosphatase)
MTTASDLEDDFDRAACGLALLDESGRFVRVNATLCDWLGYPRAELQARCFQELMTMGSKLFHQTHWMPLLQLQRSVAEVQLELLTQAGRVLPVLVNAVQRKDAQGAVRIDLALFVTTDRRKYERELLLARRRAEELLAETHEAQKARAEAELSLRADAEQRAMIAEQLMGIVSHDLRNPLHAVLLGTQMLASSDIAGSSQRIVRRIGAAAQRATRLVADILDFTRARLGGGLSAERKHIDLHGLVEDCLEEVRLAWPGRVVAHEQRGDQTSFVDPDRIAQVVSNLVNNALSYGTPNEPVTVTSTTSTESVELRVHNKGPAIPEAMQAQIFEPMQRGTEVGNTARSIGLGLYIVREIIRTHGGAVALRSSADEGTTFIVTLPNTAEA